MRVSMINLYTQGSYMSIIVSAQVCLVREKFQESSLYVHDVP
jgi:hypothetical protein